MEYVNSSTGVEKKEHQTTHNANNAGWGLGAFALDIEGCGVLSGTQAKGPTSCMPRNDEEPCNATTGFDFEVRRQRRAKSHGATCVPLG